MPEWVVSLVQILFQFCQGLIWPIILVILLVLNRHRVLQFVDIVIDRIRKGDAWGAGPLRMEQSLPQDAYSKGDKPEPIKEPSKKSDERFSWGAYTEMPEDIRKTRVIHLVHKWGDWKMDNDGMERRVVTVQLKTLPDELMNGVTKVTYYLPESWPKRLRIQEKTDPTDNFQLWTRAYGEVTVAAQVDFNDGTPPLIINRYCNFYK